jgi:hypothetical protein
LRHSAELTALHVALHFEKATADKSHQEFRSEGYPVSVHRKKRAALVTYWHSEDERLQNAFAPRSKVNDL